MKMEKRYYGDLLVLHPYGRIDTLNAEEFQNDLMEATGEDNTLTIDLIDVEYISSSGLRAFINTAKKYPDKSFSMINVNEEVMDIFEMTGFTDIFQIEPYQSNTDDIRVIFFDIDGTLLSQKTKKVPRSTIESIRKLQEKGIRCVVATGRDIHEMKNNLPLDDIHFDGFLTLNGNICLDKNEKMFAGNEIDPRDVEVLVSIFDAGRIPFMFIEEDTRYINFVDDTVLETQKKTNVTIPEVGEYKGNKVYQCISFVDSEIREKLENLLDHCKITSWNETGIDIISKDGGKAAGIQKFLDKEGFSRYQAMAFGDGENDMTMLKYVGTGVAMGNAVENLKKEADYVTTDIDDDGIRNALIHFGLLGEDE